MTTAQPSLARAVVFASLADERPSDAIEERLELAIAHGILAPGERLPSEAALADQFGAAVVTVRDALSGLRDRGLITTRRGRGGGSFVAEDADARRSVLVERIRALSAAELLDFGDAYFANVGTAAELACDRATDRELAGVRRELGDGRQPDEFAARRALGGFHIHLVGVSGSVRLVREHMRIQNDFGPLLWMCLAEEEPRRRLRALSLEAMDALERRDAGAARAAVAAATDAAARWLVAAKRGLGDGEQSRER